MIILESKRRQIKKIFNNFYMLIWLLKIKKW
jgi:hypothetical protein